MSTNKRTDVQAPSTVEAIRMASASVLGSTMGLGYPVGSAIGTGSMLEQHSDTVSMNIAPLIFHIRDTVQSSEGLELLAIEWNLERTPGPGVLPEQLIIAGGAEGGVGSHVCILCWEKGVVDPFKIDNYVKVLSKKIGDIERIVINNEMNYELEGLSVIQRFADRLNSVMFVDIIDRRFQGSWDSFQMKKENVDVDVIAKMSIYDDFTILPPSMKISHRQSLDFKLPSTTGDIVEHFKHRVLTPSAIELLTKTVPETGCEILTELNTYAYAMEEADVVEGVIDVLTEFLQRDSITLVDFNSLQNKIDDFVRLFAETVNTLEYLVETHISSGKILNVAGHREALLSDIESNIDKFEGIRHQLAKELVKKFMLSVERESMSNNEIRAWQLRGSLSYAVAYANKVTQYFSKELNQYLVVSAARESFFTALREFRSETITDGMDSTDMMLFEKFYAEVQSQLNASFSKRSYKGVQYSDYIELMDAITREMIDTFKHIDVWNLIGFSDVAEIAKAEIKKKYSTPQSDESLTDIGQAIMDILTEFEITVTEIIPDVADTILSKPLIRKMVDQMKSDGSSLSDVLSNAVESVGEKSNEWNKEALSWVEGFKESVDGTKSEAESLLALLQFVHELLGQAITASSIADRVKIEADRREVIFQTQFRAWEEECREIDTENQSIRQHNQNRDDLLDQATKTFENEMIAYEQANKEYQEKIEQYQERIEEARASETGYTGDLPPPPLEPERPSPLEPRIESIKREHPVEQEKSFPPEPKPEPSLRYYVELRDLIYDKLTEMKERESTMEDTFARRVLRLQAEGLTAISTININIGDGFLEYLMDSRIRSLGRLLPRISRVYLRDPKLSNLLYLVIYEHYNDSMTMSIGSTFLR
ncbi:hypothetical protein EU527_03660 [Candidatus Thorarchaeota archaeon]|nr:MAG: hypothetical protein EU527_03660 [Candidatus Thorarchaeota archaeon]